MTALYITIFTAAGAYLSWLCVRRAPPRPPVMARTAESTQQPRTTTPHGQPSAPPSKAPPAYESDDLGLPHPTLRLFISPFVVVCEACAAPPSCDGQAVPVFIAVGPEGGCEVADHAVNRVTAKLVG
jgi:hypothetical protein